MDIQQFKKRREADQEEELQHYIDDDLLTDIFIRVSTKTLGRCKCVNKQFNSLISNPHFITRHSSHRPLTNIRGLFHFNKGSAMIYLLPFDNSSYSSPSSNMDDLPRQRLFADDDTKRYRIILASCSGFLLLHFLDDMNFFYLCNPTTKKCLYIPKLNKKQLSSSMLENCRSVGLCIIEPSSSQYSHHVSNFYSYKLVYLYYDELRQRYRFVIFSKETRHWKLSKETISCAYTELFDWSNSVYYRGALHWLREKCDEILAFDVQKEQARIIHVPENMIIRKRTHYNQDVWFGVAPQDDLLNMVSVSGNQLVISVLGDYENMKWQVKRRIKTDWIDLTTGLPKYFDGERLVVAKNRRISEETVLSEVYICNIRTEEQNTKQLMLWLEYPRFFVPCIDTLVDL